ncbi:MAG: hypothetical protein HY094_08765 [Candidatus Melainabacteria bacterium]|nr:hypothetical protein [Candidatus Melainabacteria bacterium]
MAAILNLVCHLSAQTTVQVMVVVEKMGTVIVTLDGQILMIVQLLQYFPPQTPVQIMVSIEEKKGGAVHLKEKEA